MARKNYLLGCFLLALLLVGYGVSGEVGKDKEGKKKPASATYKVEKGPFKVEVALKGIFEAEQTTPFTLSLEAWTRQAGGPLTVHKAVEHGSVVRKGDTLLWLDLERIDQALRDLEAEQHLEDVALRLAEKELPLLEQAAPTELASTERLKKIADEDLQEFLKKGRAFSEQLAAFQVKTTRDQYEFVKEQLRQLEKMYKANDLTEETEEIVLKRERNQLEFMAFLLKMVEKDRDDTLKVELPRRDRMLREHAERQTQSLDKLRVTQPVLLIQKRLALAKLQYERGKTTDRLAKLRRDRDVLAARAPADGIVYYGRCVHGQWTTATTLAERLQRGGELHPGEVIFTIVQPKGIFVRAEVEEKELHHLQPGQAARVVPTAAPGQRLPAKIVDIGAVPISPGKFLARVAVEFKGPWLPGMACTVKVVPYRKTEALTVPVSAISTDELDDERHYVYVPGSVATRRNVKVGEKVGQRIEILEGLRAGEEILQQKPDSGTSAAAKQEDKS